MSVVSKFAQQHCTQLVRLNNPGPYAVWVSCTRHWLERSVATKMAVLGASNGHATNRVAGQAASVHV
jgi:hypothetical protein